MLPLGWDYDKLNRESVRTLPNGAQTALAYTPGGDVDYYTDPTGKTDYTWDKAGRLDYLTAPDGKTTDFDYNKNDQRTKTVYPGGTTQAVGIDDNGRPEGIKTTSGSTTLIDLAYSYENTAGKDTTKIRTRTDNLMSSVSLQNRLRGRSASRGPRWPTMRSAEDFETPNSGASWRSVKLVRQYVATSSTRSSSGRPHGRPRRAASAP